VASEGSVSAPVPQGMGEPSGWVLLVGGVVVPSAAAMAKRPVQSMVGVFGLVNW
jgi:hypothetical protein